MTNSPKAYALARLGHIADLGYSITSDAFSDQIQVLASTHSPNWTVKDIKTWLASRDPAMIWLKQNLEAVSTTAIETGPLAKACPDMGATTILSDLFSGARLSLILSHSKEALGEADIKEARAAALSLFAHRGGGAAYGITAKELIYLERVSTGATDDEIAVELQLSLRAVKERKRKAIDDLRAENIGHAIGIAKRAKLI